MHARLLLSILLSAAVAHAAEDLTVLKATPGGIETDQQLEVWLKQEFYRMVDRRSEAFEKMIKSEAAMRAWQEERKAFFLKQIGRLPERTPLKAQVVGTLHGERVSRREDPV